MEFVLDPPYGAGPLRLGMTVEEARSALGTLGPLVRDAFGGVALTMPGGLGFSVGFGVAGRSRGRVNFIELYRPYEEDVVRYRDVDVFGQAAREVVRELRRHTRVDAGEDDGCFSAPDLYLGLWRSFAADDDPDEEQGFYFQSVAVARPGYGDGPAEAAARAAVGEESGY
ncbi:hypothetical protein GCM10010435_79790 [Winogradskya consettensis]|uniref:Uncharacterized protein n=1 Tax=Winogradskya consettensis TaxID=113560 RepID=A0A919SS84_9ACTN|nr:hypothetical protein [Actinoplanes consettensis]GIM77405.1 hypothetical protein Aco04nite_55180 [Actinoplanes consettensis]